MKTIKLYFVDFWANFNPTENYFTQILSEKYNVVIDSLNPEYVFFSTAAVNVYKYPNAVKIYFTSENDVPNFNLADYAMGFYHLNFGDRYLRFPLYLLDHYAWKDLELLANKQITPEFANRKFCNFVYSNTKQADPIRDKFFFELSKYKKVDSGGRLYNNIGQPVANKKQFISEYKFTIAFENSAVDGYTTEKIIEPMMVNSIPIYWGSKTIDADFNNASLLHLKSEKDMGTLIEQITHLDQNDEDYLAMLNKPWFVRTNEKKYWRDLLITFFDNIFTQPLDEAKRVPSYGHSKPLYKEDRRVSHIKQNHLWGKCWGLLERLGYY